MKAASFVLLLFATAAGWAGDLQGVKAEPNLERRSDRALDNANRAISEARDAYAANDLEKSKAALQETVASVELSFEALEGTGKHPRSSPKHFKKAELSVREMLRRLKGLETDFNVDERPLLVATEERLQAVHERLIDGLMSKKK